MRAVIKEWLEALGRGIRFPSKYPHSDLKFILHVQFPLTIYAIAETLFELLAIFGNIISIPEIFYLYTALIL